MKQENEEIRYTNLIHYNILPEKVFDTFVSGDTTPDVENCEYWLGSGSVVTITNFLSGAICQRLYILGDGTTTLQNNTHIKTNTAANKLLAVNKVYTFTFFNSVWIENA